MPNTYKTWTYNSPVIAVTIWQKVGGSTIASSNILSFIQFYQLSFWTNVEAIEKVKYNNKTSGSTTAASNILRFPWASVEPPWTIVLRGLADLLLPTGVSVYSRCLVKWKNKTFRIYHFFSDHFALEFL
jgi:hypothetical protein